MLTFFTSFPQIFFKDFVKERRHLHFSYSIVITLASFIFAHFFMKFAGGPILVYLIIGWFEAYTFNWLREAYFEYKSNYEIEFDYLDVYAGAYGGILASIIYLLIFFK
jgi:hypothetical protein